MTFKIIAKLFVHLLVREDFRQVQAKESFGCFSSIKAGDFEFSLAFERKVDNGVSIQKRWFNRTCARIPVIWFQVISVKLELLSADWLLNADLGL